MAKRKAEAKVAAPKATPLTMTVDEAAAELGISRGTAYECARTGQIPTIRLGRRLLVPREALLRLGRGEAPHREVEAV
jgi:excisionase family DNA binding protein